MKKIIYIALAALMMACSSCTSFLNVTQLGKNTIEGWFSSPDGLYTAGIGLHRALLEYYDDEYYRLGDVQGDKVDVLRTNAGEALLLVYDFESEEAHNAGFPYYAWNKAYDVVTNANQIIYYAPRLLEKYPNRTELVNTELGYAHFTRALMIFNLCNIYAQPYDYTADASHLGVVPIDHVPGFNEILARKSMKDNYDLILSDLKKSLEYFGNDDVTSVYYISGLAVEALMARVYLYMKDYDNAAKYSKMVMDKVSLTPRDQYVGMFRRAQDVPGEAILRFNCYEAGTGMRSLCNPTGNQDVRPDQHFVDEFDDADVRKELFTFIGEEEDKPYEGMKFLAACKVLPYKHNIVEENRRSDYFLLRASEMYLIHAEACCLGSKDLTSAANDIKALRARALGVSAGEVQLTYKDAAELDSIIQDERAKELCFEGHRFFDLKRRHEDVVRYNGTSSHMQHLKYPHYRYAFPIAQLEMQANENMVQNEGY